MPTTGDCASPAAAADAAIHSGLGMYHTAVLLMKKIACTQQVEGQVKAKLEGQDMTRQPVQKHDSAQHSIHKRLAPLMLDACRRDT